MAELKPCGTYAAYQRHRKAGEPVCDPCRKANAAYMRQLRRERPDVTALDGDRTAARNRALSRLAQECPVRFRQLLAEELSRRGLVAS